MDPLSIFGAVTGGISVTSEIFKALDAAITIASRVKEAPDLAVSTLRDVGMMRQNMLRFQQLLDSEALARERGLYIPLGDARNTFTDCVASLDELESLLKPLSDPGLQPLAMSERLEWAMKDKRINQLSKRVRDAQSSLGLMLTILQHESLLEVQKAIAGLAEICQRIAPNVAHLNRRSLSNYTASRRYLDDSDDASTIRPTAVPRPDSVIVPEIVLEEDDDLDNSQDDASTSFSARFAFEEALEKSRAYRRAPNWDSEVLSFRSSVLNPHALSLLSKLSTLSLGDVSTISVIALPLCCGDISNPQHYTWGETASSYGTRRNTIAQVGEQAVVQFELEPWRYPSPPLQRPSNPSSPLSPSLPVKAGMSRMLKAMRRAFDNEIVEIAPATPATPPHTPPSPFAFSGYASLTPDKSSFPSIQKVSSLAELSNRQLKDSEWHLCHDAGGPPCFGAVEEKLDGDEVISAEQIRGAQLDLAADNGYLDAFRCQACHTTLAKIVQTRESGWSSFELWCGLSPCLRNRPACACYRKMHQLGLPSDMFFGCRMTPYGEVNCARCFRICPKCVGHDSGVSLSTDDTITSNSETGSPTKENAVTATLFAANLFPPPQGDLPQTPTSKDKLTDTSTASKSPPSPRKRPRKIRYWSLESASGMLFNQQNLILAAQRFALDHPMWSTIEKEIKDEVYILDSRLRAMEKLKYIPKSRMEVLKKRQSVLMMREGMAPAWKEMNESASQGVTFWSTSLGNMRARIDESQGLLDGLAKTNKLMKGNLPIDESTLQAFPGTTSGFNVSESIIGMAI
ncbi:hypothetical protein AK830_g11508 [Neonectria ditissima]|uniref:Fungal N-terminal domain-containing protein n=1 Tax=Neonectria ditissima TaxID=78410 RepID=A0A0P7AR59_9HYPO|nr:hypothetical protein AK830_g11508 [Neonectria ditissima]